MKKKIPQKRPLKIRRVKRILKKKTLPKKIEEGPAQLWGLHNLKAALGSRRRRKILGRGPGSGHGKTSTRGSKGQTSRSGRDVYLGFEGGQTPLIRKIPKRGFSGRRHKVYQVVNLENLSGIKDKVITPQILRDSGLIKKASGLVKVLGDGEIKEPLTLKAHAFSKKAEEKIKGAGGQVEILKLDAQRNS